MESSWQVVERAKFLKAIVMLLVVTVATMKMVPIAQLVKTNMRTILAQIDRKVQQRRRAPALLSVLFLPFYRRKIPLRRTPEHLVLLRRLCHLLRRRYLKHPQRHSNPPHRLRQDRHYCRLHLRQRRLLVALQLPRRYLLRQLEDAVGMRWEGRSKYLISLLKTPKLPGRTY